MAKSYSVIPNGIFDDKDAKVIGRHLSTTFPSGVFTAKDVLASAKPKNSPINKYFDWDDTTAAEKYRLHQAQRLISCVIVEVDGAPTRQYIGRVFVEEHAKKMYMSVEQARSNPSVWEDILRRAIKDAVAYRERYKRLKKIGPILKAINQIEKKFLREENLRG